MLTVDEYTAFVVTYLLSGAALFQLPLIMVIVDSVKPMPPKMWNKYQRHMIVAAFVIALLITPSPNIIDQFILALPVLVMYQIGILLVWLRRRPQVGPQGKEKTILKAEQQRPVIVHPTSVPATKPVIAQSMVVAQQAARSVQNMSTSQNQIRPQTMDGIVAMRAPRIQPRKRYAIYK